VSEALQIRGSDVEDGELHVRAEVSKTKEARMVDMTISTTLMSMKLHERDGYQWRLAPGEFSCGQEEVARNARLPTRRYLTDTTFAPPGATSLGR